MMRKTLLTGILTLLALASSFSAASAQLFYVYFTDKPACPHPEQHFSPEALERRERQQIAFPHFSDLPISPDYITQIRDQVDSLRFELWWWNAVSVRATDAQLESIQALPFVDRIEAMGISEVRAAGGQFSLLQLAEDQQKDTLYHLQRNLLGLDRFKEKGLDGQGVRIAVFDAGFKGAEQHPGLVHLWDSDRVLKTRDFYRGGTNVNRGSEHGTAVLGCIAGKYKDQGRIGAAPGAEFLLARTEHRWWEKEKEEDCWLAAMEWADREGADLISSSLGYDSKRYTYTDMDGRTTKVTRAAQLAARKGILVVNSAGNTGSGKFHYVSAPGDGDSVLTVGASHPMFRYPMRFSAYGPNAAGQTKPDLAAPGYVVTTDKDGSYDIFAGTSFACPLMTGFAACLLQSEPELTNMELHAKLRSLGHWAPFGDNRMGAGVPYAPYLWDERPVVAPTFKVVPQPDTFFVVMDSNVLHRDIQLNGKPCHYSILAPAGDQIVESRSFRLQKGQLVWALARKSLPAGRLRIWFEGYLWEEEGK